MVAMLGALIFLPFYNFFRGGIWEGYGGTWRYTGRCRRYREIRGDKKYGQITPLRSDPEFGGPDRPAPAGARLSEAAHKGRAFTKNFFENRPSHDTGHGPPIPPLAACFLSFFLAGHGARAGSDIFDTLEDHLGYGSDSGSGW